MEAADDDVWLPLRWRDLDCFGHVYHGEFLTLLDEARSRWFGTALRIAEPESYVVAHLEIDYLSPLSIGDGGVRVGFTLEAVGTSSLTVRETMRGGDGREVARSRTVAVLWDRSTSQSRPLTDAERAQATAQLPR